MSKPYGHNLADLTFRPAGCNGAMRSYTAKPAGQFRRLLFQKIFMEEQIHYVQTASKGL